MSSALKFLVVGATGYTGRAVVKELRRRNISTVAHIRPASPAKDKNVSYCTELGAIVDHTPWQKEGLVAMLERHQPTHIFSLLGTTKSKARAASKRGETATYEAIDRDLSILLLKAMEIVQKNIPEDGFHYLFLSSMGVTEGSRNRYLRARADVEAYIQKTKFRWLIVRPSFISGVDREESRPMERIGSVLGDALLSAISVMGMKKPYQQYGTLSADELACGIIECSLDENAHHQILETQDIRMHIG